MGIEDDSTAELSSTIYILSTNTILGCHFGGACPQFLGLR